MKNAFFRIATLACLSLLFLSAYGNGGCAEAVKGFYVEYMSNLDNPDSPFDANDRLIKRVVDPLLIEKLSEYGERTDADPIIRAQDVCRHAINSLSVEALGEDWYMVRYKWDNESDYIEIPLKAVGSDLGLKITFITPEWLGSKYGDQLLDK